MLSFNDSIKEKIKSVFNQFNGKNLDLLDSFYSDDVVFKDPIHKIEGLDSLKKYYSHAYKNVISIRFDFKKIISEGSDFAGSWDMTLQVKGLNKGQPYTVEGLSLFKINEIGLVSEHIDYVDLGAMIYERLPIQGTIIRAIKKMLAHI